MKRTFGVLGAAAAIVFLSFLVRGDADVTQPGILRFGAVTPGHCMQWHNSQFASDSGGACGGGGGSVPCVTIANSFQYNNAGAFDCNAGAIATSGGAAFWAKAIDEADFTGNFAGAADITSKSAAAGSNLNGNALVVVTGAGDGTHSGGDFEVDAGLGGATAGASGGNINLNAGSALGSTGNFGGNAGLFAGNASDGTGSGGSVEGFGGAGATGGVALLQGGNASGVGAIPGEADIRAGSASVSNGARVYIESGAPGSNANSWGDVEIDTGDLGVGYDAERGDFIVSARRFLLHGGSTTYDEPQYGTCPGHALGQAGFSDNVFQMSVTGSTTTCTVNFAHTWPNGNICVATSQVGGTWANITSSSNTSITATFYNAAGTVNLNGTVNFICMASS